MFTSLPVFYNHSQTCSKTKFRCLACKDEFNYCDAINHDISQVHLDNLNFTRAQDTGTDIEGTLLIDLENRGSPSPTDLQILPTPDVRDEIEVLQGGNDEIEVLPTEDNVRSRNIDSPPEIQQVSPSTSSAKRRTRDCDTVVIEVA